jgi:hypothetical protein
MFRRLKEDWLLASSGTHKAVVFSVILVSLMLLALVWTFLRDRDDIILPSEAAPLVEESAEETLETLVPDPSVVPKPRSMDRAVLERHFAAIGGVKRLASINSLLVTGELAIPDQGSYSVVIAKKKGQRLRVSMTRPVGTIVMVVTPEDAWRSLNQNGMLTSVEDLAEDSRDSLLRSSYVVSELFLAMNNSWTIEYLGQQALNYEMAHCFEVKVDQGHFIRFYIDPETMLDIGREERSFDEDGTLRVTRVLTSEHMDIEGLKVPARSETYQDNKLVQTFTVTDVEVNPGILDSTFVRPELPEPTN